MIDIRETSNSASYTTSDSIYDHYKEDIHNVWGNKLITEFCNQRQMYLRPVFDSSVDLNIPTFSIDNTIKRLGQWDKSNQTISIALRLLRDYSWDAVVNILKHEMAHMVVDEIFIKQGVDDNGKSHGELFKKACDIMNVQEDRLVNLEELKNYQLPDKEKIVGKIKKLIALGESQHKEEAESAITKAHELMIKYNISLSEVPSDKRVFIGRPVGNIMTKVPTYVKTLVRIIKDYYFVNAIYMSKERKYAGERDAITRYVEFYGEPHNLDIAEYVFHFLLMEAEREWKIFKESDEYKHRLDGLENSDFYYNKNGNFIRNRPATYSKVAFMDGVFYGFKNKLKEREDSVLKQINLNQNTLPLFTYDVLLQEKYKAYYNPTSWSSGNSYTGGGFDKGKSVGGNITIRSGVTRGSYNKKMISA